MISQLQNILKKVPMPLLQQEMQRRQKMHPTHRLRHRILEAVAEQWGTTPGAILAPHTWERALIPARIQAVTLLTQHCQMSLTSLVVMFGANAATLRIYRNRHPHMMSGSDYATKFLAAQKTQAQLHLSDIAFFAHQTSN